MLAVAALASCAHATTRTQTQAQTPTLTQTPTVSSTSTIEAPTALAAATDDAPLTPEDTLAREVATLRRLPLKSRLAVERLDETAFLERTRTGPADTATLATYVAFGFMRHDPRAALAPSAHAHSAYLGLFDFKTHTLFLKQGLDESTAKGVLVHEIAHALQDQSFGLPKGADAPQGSEIAIETDRALAIQSLYEGDAMLVRELYAAAEALEPAQKRLDRAVMVIRTSPRKDLAAGLGIPAEVSKGPRFSETLSTYADGMIFAARLYREDGFASVDEAYAHLPESTEQILHPDKYLTHEKPVAVDAPETPKGTTKLAEGTMGELRTRLLLGRCSKTPSVDGWGWGGDRYVISEGKDHALTLSWSTVWDTEGDAMRFENGLKHAAAHCWPSERRGGYFIGTRDVVKREGMRVTYARSE
jgi:hypothetical protein